MRVAMSAFRFDHQGGIERASYELATRLAREVDLTLVSTDVSPPPAAPLSWTRVTRPPGPDFLLPVTYSAAASRRIRDDTFDILHDQGACALRYQDIITAHSCHRAWWSMKFRNGEATQAILNPHHHAILHVESRNYRPGAYRRAIAVSNGVGRELTAFYGVPPERITVVPNGVDADRFRPADSLERRTRLRSLHGIGPDDVALLFVGKEFRRKGLASAIDALAFLPEQVKLLVVGGDDQAPFREHARQRGVAGRVVFVGHSSMVEDYFQAGDVFVFPTLYEAFALVTLEAAAAGLPLVATRVNGTEDFIRPGENGFFTERDGAALAASLRPLVDDHDLRARLGAQARRDASAYTWDAAARATLEVYREVAAEKAASIR